MMAEFEATKLSFFGVNPRVRTVHAGLRVISTEVVRDIDGFDALKESWNDTLRNSPANVVFLTHEWLTTWIRNHREAANDLRIIVTRRGSEIVGLAPLMVSRREGFRRLGSVGVESLDYEDIIVRQGADVIDVVNATVEAVFAEPGWDYWQFNRIGGSAEIVSALNNSLNASGHAWTITESEYGSIVPLVGTWDEYWQSLSKRFRKNFRRHSNRLAELGEEVEIREAKTASEISEGLECLFRFHRARRRDVSGAEGLFASPANRRFYTDLANILRKSGWLRMPTMRIDGRMIGVQFNFQYAGRLYKALPGFDDEFGDHAVGMLLNVAVMKRAFEQKLDAVDFLRGGESYKLEFRPDRLQFFSMLVFQNTARGRLGRCWIQLLRPLIRQYLDVRRLKKIRSL